MMVIHDGAPANHLRNMRRHVPIILPGDDRDVLRAILDTDVASMPAG